MLDSLISGLAMPFAAFVAAFIVPIAIAMSLAGVVALAAGRGAKGLGIGLLMTTVTGAIAIWLWTNGESRAATDQTLQVVVAGAKRNFELFLPYGVIVSAAVLLMLAVPIILRARSRA